MKKKYHNEKRLKKKDIFTISYAHVTGNGR